MTTVACLKVKNASGFKTAGNILVQKSTQKLTLFIQHFFRFKARSLLTACLKIFTSGYF